MASSRSFSIAQKSIDMFYGFTLNNPSTKPSTPTIASSLLSLFELLFMGVFVVLGFVRASERINVHIPH
jgi:hypothetical protein